MRKTKRQIEDEKYYGGKSLFDFIELEFSQGEENEQQNGELSQHREIANGVERISISSSSSSLDRQENSTIQLDNTREMGGTLSKHHQESRNVRTNDTSITTSTNGTTNFREQGSGGNERAGTNGYGDTNPNSNQSQSIHSDRTTDLFSFVSRNDDERQGANARSYNQQSVLESTTRDDDFERRSFKSGQKLDFTADDEIYLGSLKDRFQKNIHAIKLLKTIEQENRYATKQEQEILNKFSGWGGIPQVFDHQNKEWEKEFKELISTLDYTEYENAKLSTLDAFYTPKIVIDTIYQGLNHLGFNNDKHTKEIFEPSAGIGSFLSYAKNYSNNYHFTCIELDSISSNILKSLHPNQTIYNKAFEHHLFDKPYDAFIGNPPFGQKKVLDPNDTTLNKSSVHNYFIGNAIKNLKEDGIAAFVVSSYFLDSKNNTIRDYIDKQATFLGAVRLPNNAFKKRANTEVTTDIIFFKKGKDLNIDNKWLESVEYYEDRFDEAEKRGLNHNIFSYFRINEYFKNNPQNILGKMDIKSSQYGHDLECLDDGRDLKIALENFVKTLPKDIYQYQETKITLSYYRINKESPEYQKYNQVITKLKDGNYFEYGGEIYMKVRSDDELVFSKPALNEHDKRRIKKLIAIRNQFNTLIEYEKNEANDVLVENQRKQLNKLYDDFVTKEGYLNREANKKAFKEDVEANKILALEKNYNAGISKNVALKEGIEPILPSATKADIFFKRTINAQKEIKISTPQEALIACINECGRIDLNFLEANLEQPLNETLNTLEQNRLIFKDHLNPSRFILAEKYLSGNVKAKYKEVKKLIEDGFNEFANNLESLEQVLPKNLKAVDISLSLGTTWIPIKYYKQFIEETLQIDSRDYDLFLLEKTGEWNLKGLGHSLSPYVRSQYATERIGCFDLFEHALLRKPIRIYDKKQDETGREYRELNPKETAIANSKLENLKNEFAEWIYKDYDRRTDLENIYNEKFNTNKEPQYNGENLELPNFNANIKLKKHQKNAIYRAIQESNIIFDHQVGAGKTLVAICSVMEQKRMGLLNKPLIVVPNHLARQWNDEFYHAYTNANILVATNDDLKKDNRERFFSKIATNNYDAVIMTHSQFKLIPAPYGIIKRQYEKDISILEETLKRKQDDENIMRYSVKDLEKRIENFKVKLKDLQTAHKKSKAIDFSELGIDALIIDEAHEFKNLLITTSMGDISGLGNLKGSQKAYDLYCKTQYIHEQNKKLYFLTGTPISNSITELFTLQRYIQPNTLNEKGIESFDSWASTFGEVTNAWELDSSGINYKIVARFNKFKNVPELSTMYKSVADIVTNNDIMKYQKDFVPKLYNDKPINIVTPRSEAIAEFIGIQDENGRWNEGSIVWRMEHQQDDITRNNLLACTTDARKAGFDFRLINPYYDDYADSKINKLIENVYGEYNAWNDDRGTQLIFCDLSTPKQHSQKVALIGNNLSPKPNKEDEFVNINETMEQSEEENHKSLDELLAEQSKFDVYTDILKKLVAKGIPQNEIRFIHDAKTDLQKSQLFADMNTGKARILIGSTQKMGAGTNVQKRIIALHHLDCPWRPSDLEQRSGRVIRQGNELFMRDPQNFRVKEFRYATERTYDARMWQVIESKARSIEQFRKAGADVRTLEDITSGAADAAEMKAEATGNPLILLQVQLTSDLRQEEMLYSGYKRQIHNNEESLKVNLSKIEFLQKDIIKMETLNAIIKENNNEHFQGKYYINDDENISAKDFIVLKDDTSDLNKARQAELTKNFENTIQMIANNYQKEYKVLEYKGLIISGEKTDLNTLSFYVSTPDGQTIMEPENMIYKRDDKTFFTLENYVNFGGFMKRLNNFYNDLEKFSQFNKSKIESLKKEIAELENITGGNTPIYKRKDYLEALREDNRIVIEEIEKMSKQKGYKSDFVPKSAKILEDLNRHNKIMKDRELLI
ncbi:SNF2-related protein [Campylobacter helveticus]|uniref:SNF2-related protein n=1 Tax=Campylobacter helveticus TaxID=28898 RepID=UPI00214A3B7B|nr:SNF2-related protein [Campylobacter helveticus]MCR2064470.1 SNF2-related protein [Campylobacter helveticus]